MKFGKNLESLLDNIQSTMPDSADDVLSALGLQRRRNVASVILPAIGTLVVGAAIGASLGMLFGPRYGYRLMDRMGVRIPESLKEGTREGLGETRGVTSTTTGNNTIGRTRSDIHS